jgi:hypothetical protein
MTIKSFLSAITLSLALSLFAGCAMFGANLTQQELTTYGTKTLAKPLPDTFKATIGALKVMGYQIAVEDAAKGIIKTERKVIRANAIGNSTSASATNIYRQYSLKLGESEPGKTAVTATPYVFIGERNVSEDKVWVIEGPEGERQLWSSLFKEIESQL